MVEESLITDEMRKSIGTQVFPDFPPETVDMWVIKRYLEATTDENPLWKDLDYAEKSRWRGFVAPPGILEAFNPSNHAFRLYPDMSHMSLPFNPPFAKTFMAFNEWQIFEPVRPGDKLTSVCKIGDIYQRQSTSGSGRMVFIRLDNEHRNQNNTLVGICSEAMVSMEGSSGKKKIEELPSAEEIKHQPVSTDQIFYEDLDTDTYLPPLIKPFSLFTILKWAAAVNDYGPHHFDHQFATQMLGMPNVIAHGPQNTAILAQLVTNWIGKEGMLTRHYVEMRGNVFPGDTITYLGKVAKKYIQDGEAFVDIESWAENQNRRRVSLGKSTVILPQRK